MLDAKKRVGFSQGDANFLEIIDKFGWHVMSVAPRVDEEGEIFSYSTGLYMRFKHPEIILCGLDSDTSTRIINEIGGTIKARSHFEVDQDYTNIFADEVKCRFRPVLAVHYSNYVCWASWFYEYEEFPVLQCFWPDKKGHFPWEKECHPAVAKAQPLLYRPPISVM